MSHFKFEWVYELNNTDNMLDLPLLIHACGVGAEKHRLRAQWGERRTWQENYL